MDWIQLPNIDVHDVNAVYKILSALTRKFGADGTIKAVPLVFKIQSLVKTGIVKNTARQRAVAAIIVEWLIMVAEFYRIDSLIEYATDLKNERIQSNEYSAMFLDENVEASKFEDLEPENTSPVDKFVDRKSVTEMLSKDGPLRDEDDTEGTELDSKLLVEWGSEDYGKINKLYFYQKNMCIYFLPSFFFYLLVNHDRTFRIRTSRNLSDLKAKLATPWANAEVNNVSKLKQIKTCILIRLFM